MMNLNKTIEQRKPIWNVISEFYLDTELQKSDYDRISKTLIASGLNIEELKAIDLYEVFPVLKENVLSVAGIWNGFDENWLNLACEKVYHKRRSIFFRWKTKFYNRFLYPMRKDHWIEIENRLKTH
ncbi:DUF7079 family protein [Aquimarina mytili]|uniref:DUF7079 domain-containing protein n=1 Tax=Aquimarina mytili TaxID=874423 RepID=A0A936ZXH4_9FLAO|nr:hypothetical protein [Aquimarina mytili]MBL0684066.1 hypothetical protein [Aquimarina mytili]